MKLAERQVAVVLSEEGQAALQLAGVDVQEGPLPEFLVEETDDIGLWVRVSREDGNHTLLVRWEFVLSLDVPPHEARRIGLSA
jgi:hypothetical protein